MKPTPAEIEKGIPRRSSAAIPPVRASGTPENTTAASLAERNSVTSKPKINSSASGTTI